MTYRHCSIALVITMLALGGCQRDASEGPTEISGKLFIFNYRVATAVAMITLSRKSPLPDGSTVAVEYENPQGGEPLVKQMKIFPFWEKIVLESPPLHCVAKDRPYAVKIRILGPDGKVLQTLQTTVVSSLDESILPAKPLVIGPAYTKNPEVFKPDGTADYAPDPACRR